MSRNQQPSARQVGGTHYLDQDIQPWDAMRAWMTPVEFQGFLRGNAIKYLARFRNKGGVDDLKKAVHYLEKLTEALEYPVHPQPAAPASRSLFIDVPETTLRGSGIVVPAFMVSQYLASVDESGSAYISATDKPAVRINFQASRDACSKAGLSLITNLQYLSMAQNIAETAENWTGGNLGKGSLYQGLHKGTVSAAQANDFESTDPDERRWFTLSTGERIYDAAGHLFSWVVADIEGDPDTGLVNAPFAEGSPSIATASHPSFEKGVGWYPRAGSDWSGSALVRGGYFDSDVNAGLFSLNRGWPGREHVIVGFRCTLPR